MVFGHGYEVEQIRNASFVSAADIVAMADAVANENEDWHL